MTEAGYQAIQVVAFGAGVGVLFGPIMREAPPMRRKAWIESTATVLGLLLASYFLAAYRHFIWALVLTVFPSAWMTAWVRDSLDGWRRRALRRGLWAATLALCYVTTSLVGGARDRIAQEQARQARLVAQEKERQDNLARELALLRRPWRADDTPGVAELKLDRLTAWLAAPPTVEIDGAYEQELGDMAQREVPVRVVFINDSFLPVTPDVAAGLTPVRWSVRILLPGGGVLHEWNVEPAEARALQPAERQDYQVVWDGRDVRGILCPPGEYQVEVELQTAGLREARSLPLRVVEKGPIEITEVDGTTRYIQQQQEMSRWHDTIQKGLDSIERNRFQPWGR